MTLTEIKRTQSRVGAVPDGFWGPKSIAACQRHLRDMMPAVACPTKSHVTSFYGPHGEPDGGYTPPLKSIKLPFTIYYEGASVRTLKAHEKCADSLLAVFERLKSMMTVDELFEAGVLTYDGLYNPRKMRGSSAWSMHSWAIAIDFDAARNGNTTHWPTKAHMPIEVMECFAQEGWTAAGAFWSRDGMHMEAVRPY